ncbi:hypothetical protein [Micromonospora sp. b486]|uniref:hypothetical protein n=1 Tax=Micromonospora sp. b486 TaxID=3053986 RepID=UPI00338D86B0
MVAPPAAGRCRHAAGRARPPPAALIPEAGGFAGYARPPVLVGLLLAWRRVPFVLVVVAAAATTAVLRLLGVA